MSHKKGHSAAKMAKESPTEKPDAKNQDVVKKSPPSAGAGKKAIGKKSPPTAEAPVADKMAKKSPSKMSHKSPAKKALVGKQENLPEHLKAKIKAAPGKMIKKSAAKMMKKGPAKMKYKK